jgi:hypothetical protein
MVKIRSRSSLEMLGFIYVGYLTILSSSDPLLSLQASLNDLHNLTEKLQIVSGISLSLKLEEIVSFQYNNEQFKILAQVMR